ncbi:MAG: type II toxin-antitoxin system ParD family antitoxin [Terriglobia bacterium]|jgi:antitoxin ParD1/3/4
MKVSLSRQLQGFIEKQVSTGRYQTASEVVREGLRLIEDRDTQRALQLRRLREEIQVGLDQIEKGQVAPLDVKKIKAEGRKRLAARRRKDVG